MISILAQVVKVLAKFSKESEITSEGTAPRIKQAGELSSRHCS